MKWTWRAAAATAMVLGVGVFAAPALTQEKGRITPQDAAIIEAVRQATTVIGEKENEYIQALAKDLDREIATAFEAHPETRDAFAKQLTQIAAIKDHEEKLRAAQRFVQTNRDTYLGVLRDGGVDLEAFAERLQRAFAEAGRTDVIVRLRPDLAFEIEPSDNDKDTYQGVRIPVDGDAEPPKPPPSPPPAFTRTLGASEYVDSRSQQCAVFAGSNVTISPTDIANGNTVAVGGTCAQTGAKLATIQTTVRAPAVNASASGQVSAFAIGILGMAMCTARADTIAFNSDGSIGGSTPLFAGAIAPFLWVASERGTTTMGASTTSDRVRVLYATSTFTAGGPTPAVALLTVTGADCQARISTIRTDVTQ